MNQKAKAKNPYKIFIRSMNFLTWIVIFVAMLFFEKARPQTKTILDLHYSKSIRNTWDFNMVNLSLWFFVISVSLSLIGLLVNLIFIGDKKHPLSIGLLLSFIISLSASLAYMYLL